MKYLSALMSLTLFFFVSPTWSQSGQEQVEEAKKICAGATSDLMEDCPS